MAEDERPIRKGSPVKVNSKQLTTILTGTISGLPTAEIAKSAGLTSETVTRHQVMLKPLLELADYTRQNKANIGDVVEGMLMKGISFLVESDVWEKASLSERVNAAEKLHKIMRLEKGQSTTNIAALLKTGDALED